MAKNDFSDIRNYAELESSIRMVRHQLKASNLSQQVSNIKAQDGPGWTIVALLAIRSLRRWLVK